MTAVNLEMTTGEDEVSFFIVTLGLHPDCDISLSYATPFFFAEGVVFKSRLACHSHPLHLRLSCTLDVLCLCYCLLMAGSDVSPVLMGEGD